MSAHSQRLLGKSQQQEISKAEAAEGHGQDTPSKLSLSLHANPPLHEL